MTSGFVLQLAGGPCAGTFSTRHGPVALLAVRDPDGKTDVLDAPEDAPALLEDTFRYVEHGVRSTMFLDGTPSVTGCWVTVTYRFAGPVDWRGSGEFLPIAHDESLRLMADWQADERRRTIALLSRTRAPDDAATAAAAAAPRTRLSAPVVQRALF